MTPQELYEQQRLIGNTDDITCNPNPDYNQPFYQNIFYLMAEYHSRISGYDSCGYKEELSYAEYRIKELHQQEREQIREAFEILKTKLDEIIALEKEERLPSVNEIISRAYVKTTLPVKNNKHADKIAAISRVIWVADYLNGGWQPDWNNSYQEKWIFRIHNHEISIVYGASIKSGFIAFKSGEIAYKARQILGDETIKTALS